MADAGAPSRHRRQAGRAAGAAARARSRRSSCSPAASPNARKVLAFSHVQYADGTVMPVRELCHLRVSATSSASSRRAGTRHARFRMRDLGCDFYAACFHKWLGGCHGTGMLYVRREMLDGCGRRRRAASMPRRRVVTPTQAPDTWACRRPCTSSATSCRTRGRRCAARGCARFAAADRRARIEARMRELAIYARLRLQQLPGVELLTPARPGSVGRHPDASAARAGSAADIAPALARGIACIVRDLALAGAADGALRVVAAHVQHARRGGAAGAGRCSRQLPIDCDLNASPARLHRPRSLISNGASYLLLTGSLSGLSACSLTRSSGRSPNCFGRECAQRLLRSSAASGSAAAHAVRARARLLFWLSWGLAAMVDVAWWVRGLRSAALCWLSHWPLPRSQPGARTPIDVARHVTDRVALGDDLHDRRLACAWSWQRRCKLELALG